MKATLHFGKGKALHNDRHFDLDKADHIDQERTSLNYCRNYSLDPSEQKMPFEDFEKQFYIKRYTESLTATNEKYMAQRHPEKVRTIDDWMRIYKPTEAIIQLGNADEQINYKYLAKAFTETMEQMKEKYPQMIPLNVAIHRDEATPHIHLRFVIEGHDRNGHLKPLKTQGLKEMGVQRPDLSKPEGKYNNPLMSFTNEMREILYRNIELLGLELDRTPHLNQEHIETLQYKRDRMAEDIQKMETEREQMEQAYRVEQEKMEEQIAVARTDYDAQRATLAAQYEAEKARLDAEYADKKRIIAEREANIARKEALISGRELKVQEVEQLQQKTFWSPEEKQNIIQTALKSAQNAQKARKAISMERDARENEEAIRKQYTALQAQNERLQAEQLSEMDKSTLGIQRREIEELKRDIAVRDDFIQKLSLKAQFMEYCRDLGHKLHIMTEDLSHGIRMR